MNIDLCRLETLLGYKFKNRELLFQAMTHSSYANENQGERKYRDNERLEFLGDAVLNMVVSNIIFSGGDKPEGVLTKLRAAVVCERNLAETGREQGFNEFLLLGKGEEQNGGRERDSIVADSIEAMIAAVYLDSGYDAASELIKRLFAKSIAEAEAGRLKRDSKTELQERLQQAGARRRIEYAQLAESGPDHDKLFRFTVIVDGKPMGTGSGKSKKEAQTKAAEAALKGL